MDQLAYYNWGFGPARGLARPKVWARRLLRKLLLPTSQRLVEILGEFCRRLDGAEAGARDLQAQLDDLRGRQEDQATKLAGTTAFGWDYVALVRRLAVLEEHVDALLIARDDREAKAAAVAGSIGPEPTINPISVPHIRVG